MMKFQLRSCIFTLGLTACCLFTSVSQAQTPVVEAEEGYPTTSAEANFQDVGPGPSFNRDELNNYDQDADVPIYDMRGDDGVLMDFRPSGLTFLSPHRVLICEENNQQLHIFDTEGRRYRRLNNPRNISQPRYTGIANTEKNKYLTVGSHYHINNNVRFVWARSVLHNYELRGEIFTDNSADKNLDPEFAWRNFGHYGENTKDPLKVEGIACDKAHDTVYFALSHPVNDDESVRIVKAPLSQIMEQRKKISFENVNTNLVPGLDDSINELFVLTDISYVPDKGLLILISSRTPDERKAGTSQIWFKPEGVDSARLIADNIAPGNFATGVAAISNGSNYNVGIVFDNNPAQNDTPSRFLFLENIDL